jgi:hypothetical protein
MVEYFDTPLVFDLLAPVGENRTTEGVLNIEFGGGGGMTEEMIVDLTLTEPDGEVTVPAGTLSPVAIFDVIQTSDFLGGAYPLRVVTSAGNVFVASYGGDDGRFSIELVEAWG